MKFLKNICLAGVLGGLGVILLDCAAVFFDLRMTPVLFALVLVLATGLLAVLGKWNLRRVLTLAGAVVVGTAVFCGICFGVWHTFQKTASYRDVDVHKQQVYEGREVMVIVPHQDDEINLLGGVIEEFMAYGSNVRIVFVTNGDFDGIPQTRMEEAIAYGALVGIPEENILFLGYGDRWDPDWGYHVYNAPEGLTVPSRYGAVQTYGMESHPAYREGNAYTAANYLADMESVILEYRPEVIFCSDYDDHIEHQAVSLNFEKAMGNILRQNPDYQPIVYKGYAYNTAWYAAPDFYGPNIRSTENVFEEPFCNEPRVYRWEGGIRFPVDGGTLSRSLVSSDAYEALHIYASQNGQTFARSVVNGDRVFWQRRTDSLLARAEVTASSGDSGLLNNFMRIDNFDLWEQEHPYDGVWIPEDDDPEKKVTVTFPEPQNIYSIVLYDHPSETDNVLEAEIGFDDGTSIRTGALDAGGAATEILVEKQGVKGFAVTLLETEGENPGLTEIEALPTRTQGDVAFAKLMDASGQFVYDYWLCDGDTGVFALYTHGMELRQLQAASDNPNVAVSVSGGEVHVTCPKGEEGTITLSDENGRTLDSVFVSNPGIAKRLHTRMGQRMEEYAAFQFRNSMVFRLGKRAVGILQIIL